MKIIGFLNSYKILLAIIIVLGIILRIYGLGFGLPFQFHQDEPIVVNHAMAYGTGDLNPHFFAIPPLTSYLLFFLYGILYVVGYLLGIWSGTDAFVVKFFNDPGIFYYIGRLFIGVIPGILCVFFTYFLARNIMNKKGALFAAVVMSFSFLNVVNSHYIYTDMLLTVFIILSFLLFFRLFDCRARKYYILIGIVLGLAVGTKYNGIFLLIPFMVTHIFLSTEEYTKNKVRGISFFVKWLSLFGLIAATTFIVTNPFSILDLKGFLSSSLKQGGAFWYTSVMHHLSYSLVQGISWPITLAGVCGMIFIAQKEKKGLIFLSFPILYYILLIFRSQHFSRYVLPLIPFFAIGAAYFVFEIIYGGTKTRFAKNTIIFISILLIVPTFLKAVEADILLSNTDTRIIAAQWIKKNIPEGSLIACDSTFFRPALKQPYTQILEKRDFMRNNGLLSDIKKKKFEYELLSLDRDKQGYPLYFLFEEPEGQVQFSDTLPALGYDLNELKKKGIEYVTINGQVFSAGKISFIDQLQENADLLYTFSPYYDGSFRNRDVVATTCIPVMTMDIFTRKEAGPSIRIYRIK